MANGLVRSFGNTDSHSRDDEGFGLWREIDRVFDNLARSFGREGAAAAHKGFAREVLAPQHDLPEIPLGAEPAHSHAHTHAPAPAYTPAPAQMTARPAPSFTEEAPRAPMQPLKSEALAQPTQPTPIRINRPATSANTGPLNPIADAYEDEDNFEVVVELAGVRPDDIDIEFAEGGLNITAERKRATEAGDEKKHHVRERSFGTYKRRFPIPFQANPDIIRAAFEDGLVIVTVPRPPETKPRIKKIGLKKL